MREKKREQRSIYLILYLLIIVVLSCVLVFSCTSSGGDNGGSLIDEGDPYIIEDPAGDSYSSVQTIVLDEEFIYCGGRDNASGDDLWRVEKRRRDDGSLVTGFATDGVLYSVAVEIGGQGIVRELQVDDSSLFICGDANGIPYRIERRDKVTGELVTSFGTDGYIVSYSTGQPGDQYLDFTIDGDYLYIIGGNDLPGNEQWFIEKRSKASGALVAAFEDHTIDDGAYEPVAVNGVVQSNPSTGEDQPTGIVVDGEYIFVCGRDYLPGSTYQMRVEKRSKTTGVLVSAFEDHTIVDGTYVPVAVNGVVQSNPGAGYEFFNSVAVDGDYLYLAGSNWLDGYDWNAEFWIEKRNKTTGALVTAFEDHTIVDSDYTPIPINGVVQSNTTVDRDLLYAIAVDADAVYVAGMDDLGGEQWHIEKRDKTTGDLVADFEEHSIDAGAKPVTTVGGVVQSNASTYWDWPSDIVVDRSFIFCAGWYSPGDIRKWRIEKRYKSSGAYE